MEEAVLLQGPVRGVRARLAELLAEWPDHPLLTQLAAIADRLLGELFLMVAHAESHFAAITCGRVGIGVHHDHMQLSRACLSFPNVLSRESSCCTPTTGLPVESPLKAALTGLELLVARAQLWQTTAAKHVSLDPQLQAVTALAGRWRRLELASWRRLLARTIDAYAAGAAALAHAAVLADHQQLVQHEAISPRRSKFLSDVFIQTSTLFDIHARAPCHEIDP